MLKSRLGPVSFLLVLCVAGSALAGDVTPHFEGLGNFHRAVSTQLQEAQRYFDQGMVLYFGFNDEEALNSFRAAAALDPTCAMAYWGSALAVGPNINNPDMDEDAVRVAHESITQALAQFDTASAVERALIQALARRYVESPPEDRSALDLAYANAMREVWRAHPEDPEVGALFAESMMDLRPWDLFDAEGEMQPGTDEIISTLETVLAAHPEHPFANHLYIHTMEASKEPQRALASADRLRDLVPAAGHLL
ncbi:MAG TPA: hypothetical protein VKA63_11200, partial [Candidatus Krumholzibacteria bacterium]|nr:hypothetical protein [Candidatus Krumholzibacteria bacterium]